MKFHALFSLLTVATSSTLTAGERNGGTSIEENQEEGGGSSGLRKNKNNRALTEGLSIPTESRIVGGRDAPDDAYPFYVSWEGCGASLVASDVILSAAHCRGQSTNQVRVGRQGPNNNGVSRRITRRISHPNYRDSSVTYDYMVMKLNRPVDENVYTPIRLNQDSNVPEEEDKLTVIGFGALSEGGFATPSKLQEVDVNYISSRTCNRSYGGDVKDDIMFCAGTGGGKDSCQGDSGGPIFTNTEPIEQVGIVSWGRGCAQRNYPGVYSRISGEYDWIKAQVCSLASVKPEFCTNGNNNPAPAPAPTPTLIPVPVQEPTSPPISRPEPTSPPISGPEPTSRPTLNGNNSGEVSVRLEIFYDNYPSEVGWTFEQNGQIVSSQAQGSIFLKGEAQYQVTLGPGDATFTITDSFGDGICCAYTVDTNQGYKIIDERSNRILARNAGSYGLSQVEEFVIPNDVQAPAPTPTPAPAPTSAQYPSGWWWCDLLPDFC